MPKHNKMEAHEALVEAAREALEEVNGDTSVSQEQTIDSLEDLIRHAQDCVNVIREELGK